jgi:hypothetical protein
LRKRVVVPAFRVRRGAIGRSSQPESGYLESLFPNAARAWPIWLKLRRPSRGRARMRTPRKPRQKPIAQLMVYALALSRRTGLRLYDFVCAWFDEHHYFEFYPLHVVHKRGRPAGSGTGPLKA